MERLLFTGGIPETRAQGVAHGVRTENKSLSEYLRKTS